ncbi:uncharacterized protein A4U43_C09F9130 [Asparagus officinalis]|uniref:UV-B-induced protein At3g17800, chloroplastic-like n=1 Tax=Asparagus officinalis TaxID=4686 RepID=A0A5P1E9M2_ASPOF|nr:UV-B-induced protein At3g17800, chloroplastic-like [Asparagus officinalis]ONK58177.1 uncharacterized protein A4U43_C09F9130 [Asparagus officinalis]
MDCCAQFSLKASPICAKSASAVRSQGAGFRFQHRSSFRKFESLGPFHPPPLGFQCLSEFCHGNSFACARAPSLVTTACAESNDYASRSVGTPLEPQTPEGKFLCGILKNHPHIFSVAASEQLKELATDRDNALARLEHSAGSSESCLHGRIAEIKELECQISIEEVMYLLIVHNFYEIKVSMIPNLSKCTDDGRLGIWSSKVQELESIHGPEIQEMIREHLSNILRWKGTDTMYTLKIKRLQLGRIYAASVMYGYFLKSVSLRYHLELSLPSMNLPTPLFQNNQNEENLVALRYSDELRGYMMSFDSKTLQLCAKLRSQEAANLIEKHTAALFGYPDKYDGNGGEVITVSDLGLRRLVMEALAFGTFLWDVERYVDSVYRLKEN